MNNLDKFISMLQTELNNRSFYVLGAQGQTLDKVTTAWIKTREHNNASNVKRATAGWQWRVDNGFTKARAFDCSGLGIWILQQMGLITGDTTANGMYGWSPTKLTRSTCKRGDWVFRGSASKKTHIGYIVDDKGTVIECKGRAILDSKGNVKDPNGVVTSKVSDSYWQYFARPKFFKAEIESGQQDAPAILKVTTPYMRGEGIKKLQEAFNLLGYPSGEADGIFGNNTNRALTGFIAAQTKGA